MKAIVLAAGRGSRMEEGTANNPKCMMKVFGKTLIDHCIQSLLKAGFPISDIGIVTGYKKEQIQVEGTHYFHNEDWESTNMFISLTKAREWLLAEPCIVCYSDIIFQPSVVKKLMDSKSEYSVTYYTGFWDLWSNRFTNPLEDLETFKVSGSRVVEIGKKANIKSEIEGQYMGLIRFEPSGWLKVEEAIKLPMPKPVERLDMTTLLQHLVELGYEIEAIPTDEMWLECDNMHDISIYERLYS